MKTANQYFREVFGHKMYKASICLDVTCPNRDGSKGIGGCIFCSEGGSGEFASSRADTVTCQIRKAIGQVSEKAGKDAGYIAYFQGGLTYEHSRFGVIKSVDTLYRKGYLPDGAL